MELTEQSGSTDGSDGLTHLFHVADDLVQASAESPEQIDRFADAIASVRELNGWSDGSVRATLAQLAFRSPLLHDLPPRDAIRAILRMLRLIAGIREASLWLPDSGGARCSEHSGVDPSRRARNAARQLLAGDDASSSSSALIRALPVRRWNRLLAALVVKLPAAARDDSLATAANAAASLSPVLERAAILERNATRDRVLTESADRRFVRLALDMHDGPLQAVVALLGDVRLYKRQIAQHFANAPNVHLLMGRVDDFEARLIAIDAELRQLALLYESPSIFDQPLADAIETEVAPTAAAGVRTSVNIDIDPTTLSPSQRIALLRIVKEGLANVRDHSGAGNVSIRIDDRKDHVVLEIEDDGAGFEVERTLVRAARRGRLGLVGMAERVRLLGGVFEIDSGPGRGTRISVALPSWQPLDTDLDA